MAESAATVLDARRRQLGLSRQDCWFAYSRSAGMRDIGYLTELLRREGITSMHLVPSRARAVPVVARCQPVAHLAPGAHWR